MQTDRDIDRQTNIYIDISIDRQTDIQKTRFMGIRLDEIQKHNVVFAPDYK